MDIFFPHTFRERAAFKESAVKCGFVELTAETAANVGILPADERISILLMAWKNIGNYLSKNPYSNDVGITVSWVGRCTLNLWFGREWIACAIEDKTELIEQMMKVYPAAFITMHPYSWPYMFSIYRDPWMVEYLNLNFQRMSGPDLTPVLESKDSEFIQQEGIPLLILRMVNMFDFRMVKLVKYMCLRLLLTWQDSNSTASKTLRASPNANQYINYARHIYLLAICESNGFKDLHYTLETIQRVVHCDLKEIWPLELGAQAIAKGLQETNTTLTELLIEFLFKVPKIQFGNMFGSALTKYIYFLTEYQLRNINRLSSVKLSLPIQEVYSKLVEMFITHRESSEELIKTTSKLSEQIFREFHNLTASKCAYELIKQRPRPEWYTSKITLLLTIISEEVNIIQDYKYNDVQSTDELIEKEKEVALYYRDLAKLFHKSPYLEQEAWLTTFSLHPCREFMDAVIKCGGRNLRAIKKQAHKLNVIEAPEPKTKINEDPTIILKEEDVEKQSQKVIDQNVSDITAETIMPSANSSLVDTSETIAPNAPSDPTEAEIKSKAKRPPRTKSVKHESKKIEPKIKDESKNKNINILTEDDLTTEDKTSSPFKRGRPVGSLNKDTKSRLKPANSMQKTPAKKSGERPDLAEEIFAAAAGAADNINSQTIETIKYPAFALMNSVTDTEELMKFTNYDEAYEQYTELNRILSSIKLNRTCYEDLLTLLIAPRYKRLTWAVSWKKLKKRCRVILTKDNKKRELVEQSMADANDRLTHLNIDYNKYKDKPQIDYGTIEGGYECYDTDSDDDELKTNGADVKKQNERQSNKKKVGKFVGSSNKNLQIKEETNNTDVGVKPYLKIENLDSTNTNLLNIIESTHLSKPVYLNKPVYFVRNPLASPLNETAISLECALENKPSSRTSSRRSTGEETLTSDSFEEHHLHLAHTEALQNLKDQQNNASQLTPMTFNIPASIREQLEQPTMFFKSEVKDDSKVIASVSKPEELQFENKITDSSEALAFLPSKVDKLCDPASTPNQTNSNSTVSTSFSPKLFEDMPEDLTMPKSSNTETHETNTPNSNLPLNLTNNLVNESVSKSVSFQEESPNSVDDNQAVERPLKKGRKRPLKSETKINPRKRQTKKDKLNLTNEDLKDVKAPPADTQLSSNEQSLISTPTCSLKSVRILPTNKNAKAIRINPTAAVVFSSAAASYHRTPFLNVAEQEPNILQQLLSKEIEPFSGIDEFFDKNTAVNAESVSTSREDKTQAFTPDTQGEAIQISDPITSNAASTLEIKNSNSQSSLSAVTLNPKSDIGPFLLDKSISCASGIKKTYVQNVDGETNNALRNHDKTILPTIKENLVAEESPTTPNEDCLKAVHGDLAAAESDRIKLTSNFLEQSKNIQFCSSDFDFEFKVPAVVPKPCSFLQSKQKKVSHYVSDWVKNITFNDKTAEIIVPVSRFKELRESFDRTKMVGAEDKQYNKCSCSNELKPSISKTPSDDILYNKLFNTKLLDPHLKTYKNTKASGKIADAKKFKPTYLETDEVFTENPEESNVFDKNQFDPTIPNAISEQSTDSTLEKVTSPHDKQMPPLSATPSQNIGCTSKTPSESDVEHTSNKANKRRSRNIPYRKNFNKMFDWIDMVTTSSRSESIDKSETLLNLFSAQLMNQAKSIHFNSEYLREKELLKSRANEDGINCEASILIASPGPSEDCVKLVKAFKKSTVFKGVDLSSNDVSFTSSLAKEVLGTIIKMTLNESKTHTSCSGDHFDASDALDEFIRSRRGANSPTFYSPTLSMKHLKNGTLADSVECIDTSLEKFIPKKGRKRSTVPAPAPVTKRIKNRRSTDCPVLSECKKQPLDEDNLLPLKEVERISETNVADTLKTQQEITMASDCSKTEITETESESEKVTKPLVHIYEEQNSLNQFPEVNDNALESNTKETSVNEDIMQSVTNENILQKDQSIELSQKDKKIEQNVNSLETFDLKLELSEEKEQRDGSGEQVNSKDKEHDIEIKPPLPIKKIKIERNTSVFHRTRRNTYDGTKYILKEETEIISSRTKKTKKISGDNKLDNLEGQTCKLLSEEYKSDEPKDLAEKDAPNTKANELQETEKEADNFQIEDSLEANHKVCIPDEKDLVKLDENVSLNNENLPMEENILLGESNKDLQVKNEPEDLKEETNQQIVEELNHFEIQKEELECPLPNVLPVEENKHSVPKKRVAKPIISYVELDSDSDEPPKSRLKIPSLKINFPLIRPCRRKLLNRSVAKKNVSSKCSAKRAPKTVKKNQKKSRKSFVRSKKNADSSLNESEDDKPLLTTNNKPESDKVKKFDDSEADNRPTQHHDILNASDDDAPLKKIPNRLSARKKPPPLLTPMKKKTTSKLPVRKRYRNAYSPKRPSVRIQSKFSRRRTTSLNYFALFLSDSDEEDPVQTRKRSRTPDRLWTNRSVKRKTAIETVNKKASHKRKLRCNRVAIKQRQTRNRLPKPQIPIKMPVLTREDSDHPVEENIYECATMSTANESDEDACPDRRPKRRRQKVVKPMRIRCVSRRAIPTDVITESSSCSSNATVQTSRDLGKNNTSVTSFTRRGRLLRRKTLEKNLLMSNLCCESSSSSSPVMMNRRRRQFAAKSTSKPPLPKEQTEQTNEKNSEPLSSMEKKAIQIHNCVNLQIRLQRLTANEAILCRKPYIRLDRNFVQNYFVEKNMEYNDESEQE
ncbi:uncharacterized protein LOC129944407 isoform X2 [Eupeodes corollae]|uniref:uncharacterized protein LOC129944407 isoform X2 n=1 Tax=Eupeodes corollae TaxID=290404 RepID=UPI0024935FCD|nr:uncharacterized protein LOC129944407 isoform X2 [Eupeodes corollae]